ncbi:MAG: Na(+)/H(+) antiporter subunit B [Aaplasma endosymbiont of Hyalomma asiaticum]
MGSSVRNAGILSGDSALRYIVSFMFSVILIYGFYVHFHGDYSPGGGFQGGVVVASAVILYAMVFGCSQVCMALPSLGAVAAIGLFIYFVTGIVSVFLGGSFLSYIFLLFDSVTEQKLGVFVVELGVGLTVFSSVVSIYFDFASLQNDIH